MLQASAVTLLREAVGLVWGLFKHAMCATCASYKFYVDMSPSSVCLQLVKEDKAKVG